VMVWFHGGGYSVGGGSAPWYDGHNLAAHQGAVVVTINHRLNVFGFLYLDELAGEAFAGSGNAGMLDCVAALRWVRDNIARFGGDPGNVTIFGESGGAGKVSTLMAMPSARGLFHRAIAESGAALKHATRDQATKAAHALLDALGLQPADLGRLQSLPVEDVLAAMGKVRLPGAFNPVVDGVAIPHDPFDPTAPMASADVPFMTGSNLTEATFFPDTPLDPLDDAALLGHVKSYTHTDDAGAARLVAVYRAENPGRDNVFVYQLIASDYWMRWGVLLQAERKAALRRAPVYVYQFNRMSPARGGKLHCPHGSEIPYAFDNLSTAPDLVGPPARGQALANRMSAAWVAFARTGDPSVAGGLHWPAYGAERRVMVFDDHSRVETDPGGKGRAAIAALKRGQAEG
jgi:para-nitrobenzyl esterase